MKSRTRTATQLSKFLFLALFLALAPAALASSTWYVDGVNGNDINDCLSSQTACKTIGHAISLCSSGDSIMVAPAVYIENLTIDRSLKIVGSDAATTIVDGNQAGTVFTITNAKAHVHLSHLTIRNGSAQNGGGISNAGMLTINNNTVTGNGAYLGGGISNAGTLTINKSTINGNSVGACGAGIISTGTLMVNNSTISGNVGGNNTGGGGICNEPDAIALINNSTISGNHAYMGGGIIGSGPVTIQNSMVANNSAACCHANCVPWTPITSNGYNLSSDDTCSFTGPGDMNNTDPKLGKLGNHGGPTQTIPLLPDSPAIDAGNPNGCTDDKGNLLKKDQRGWRRPGKNDTGGCDIGAFELQHD